MGGEGWQGKVKRQKDGGPVGWDIDSVTARSLLDYGIPCCYFFHCALKVNHDL